MKTARASLIALVLLAAAALGAVFAGLYDVAADDEHTGPVRWLLETARERSVERRSASVRPPAWLAAPEPGVVRRGVVQYQRTCAACHGSPAAAISEMAQGLNPYPPELALEKAEEPAEVFWVTKHGIKMTGMPAFSSVYSDEEIWAIVAAVERLPEMTREEYQRYASAP